MLNSQLIGFFNVHMIGCESAILADCSVSPGSQVNSLPSQIVLLDVLCSHDFWTFMVLCKPMFIAINLLAVKARINCRPM
jgi:hypothetical protein